jgi:hypothetical protein
VELGVGALRSSAVVGNGRVEPDEDGRRQHPAGLPRQGEVHAPARNVSTGAYSYVDYLCSDRSRRD